MWGVSVTLGKLQQGPVRRRGLNREGLQHGAAQMIAFQRVIKRIIVEQRSPRRVDDVSSLLHLGERIPVDHFRRLRRHTGMQRHDIGFSKQLRQAKFGSRRRANPPPRAARKDR